MQQSSELAWYVEHHWNPNLAHILTDDKEVREAAQSRNRRHESRQQTRKPSRVSWDNRIILAAFPISHLRNPVALKHPQGIYMNRNSNLLANPNPNLLKP